MGFPLSKKDAIREGNSRHGKKMKPFGFLRRAVDGGTRKAALLGDVVRFISRRGFGEVVEKGVGEKITACDRKKRSRRKTVSVWGILLDQEPPSRDACRRDTGCNSEKTKK